jgi:competence protein ComEC
MKNIFCLIGIFFCFVVPAQSETTLVQNLRVHFIDVGYGDAIFIQFPDETTMLVDAGGDPVNYLASLNIERIDTAIITHPHTNHFEGFVNILKNMSVHRVFINGDPNSEEGYEELLAEFERKKIPVRTLRRGDNIDQLPDEVELEILHPQDLTGSTNGNSIVMWLKYKNASLLLTGDIDLAVQEELIALYPEINLAGVVKVPHHGGPINEAFAAQVSADSLCVISTGPNRWQIPSKEDVQKLKGTVLRTDEQGTIVVETQGRQWHVL